MASVLTALSPRLEAGESPRLPSDYLVKTWRADDGLRDHTIVDIAQTTNGYLWMTTFNGLIRFDGLEFRSFDRDNTPALGTRNLAGMLGDTAGRLWVSNGRGEMILLENGVFRLVPVAGIGTEPSDGIAGIEQRGPNTFWLLTGNGRTHVWHDGQVEIDGGLREGIPAGVRIMHAAAPSVRWCWRPAARFPGEVELGFAHGGEFSPASGPEGLSHFSMIRYTPRMKGGIWILLVEKEGTTVRALLPDGTISSSRPLPQLAGAGVSDIQADGNGNLWFATGGRGVIRVAESGASEEFGVREGLGADIARCVFMDADGDIWAGTEGGGLSRISRRIFFPMGEQFGIAQSVWVAGAGDIWMATHGKGTFLYRDGQFISVPGADDFSYSLHIDGEGSPWIGGLTSGAYRVSDGHAVLATGEAPIRGFCDDPAGGVFAAGPALMHSYGSKLEPVRGWPGKAQVSCLAFDKKGTLWIGTYGEGLWSMREGHFTNYLRSDALPRDTIYALHPDDEGAVWIGSLGGGLARAQEGKFSALAVADGLGDGTIHGIAEDARGSFWFTSGGGIFRVPRLQLEAFFEGRVHSIHSLEYNKYDGLETIQSSAGSQPKISVSPGGRLFFATMKGLAAVDPARMPAYARPPPVVIEEVLLDSRTTPFPEGAGGEESDAVIAPPGTRLVEIHYAAPFLAAPEKVRYKYRFDGRDTDWAEAGSRRFAAFDRLGPGHYRFRVIAANGDGVWNETGASLAFAVAPFFWQMTWFRVAAIGSLLAVLAVVLRYLSQIKLRRRLVVLEREQAVHNERSRIARDMHDDVGSALTQVTLLGALAYEDAGEAERSRGHLSQLRDVSGEVIRKLDELVWVINPKNDTAQGLVDYMGQYATQYLQAAPLRLRLDFQPGLPALPLPADARHQVFMAFKEALNNLVKHSGATEVRLRASMQPGFICFEIEDNGRGFDAGRQTAGCDGLANMRQRLANVGGECQFESEPGKGAIVRFRVPLTKSHES